MADALTSTDPRYAQFVALRYSDPRIRNITCYGYGVADDATIEDYAARPMTQVWRPPHVGDAYGINIQTYGLLHRVTAQTVCEFAERDGLRRLPDPGLYGPLPKPSPSHRLVALFYGRRGDRFEYHTLREHEGIWTNKFGSGVKPCIEDQSKKIVTDPRKAMFYNIQEGPFFFEAPEAGIDMRLRPDHGLILDRIHEAHQAFAQAAVKKRVSLKNTTLARDFDYLATLVSPVNATFAKELDLLRQLHTTGEAPVGLKLRPGVFRPTG